MGLVIAYVGAHPILVSLAMMIFIRGLGEFLTRGGDISGFPSFIRPIGHGSLLGIPIPLLVFLAAAAVWYVMLGRTRHGFSTYMLGSNIEATRYSGIPTKRTLTLIYTLSGLMCAIAGIIMVARFNSVRVGHGEAYLLITVLACFLGGVDPFGGFGRVVPVALAPPHPPGAVLGPQPDRRQPAPVDRGVGPFSHRRDGHPLRLAETEPRAAMRHAVNHDRAGGAA